MKRKYILLSTILLVAIVFGNQSCEGMDANFREYLGERNYSGRIDNLTATPGIERVVLRWTNPADQRSRGIRIVYGPDNRVIEFDTLVDYASIEGLVGTGGLEFTVFTVDAFGNLSVPVSTTAMPVPRDFDVNLAAPTPFAVAVGLDQSISFIGASNAVMRFSGRINYTITAPDGTIFQGEANMPEQAGALQANLLVPEHLGVVMLPQGTYTVDFSIAVYPIMGGIVTEDIVWLVGSRYMQVEPLRFNLTAPELGTYSANSPISVGGGGAEGIHQVFSDGTGKFLVFYNQAPRPVIDGVTGLTWMQWRLDRAFGITDYVLTMANDAQGRDPRDWVILASNDGQTWVEIDRQTDWNPPGRTVRHSRWTFEVPPTDAFYYWRMFVTANHGGGGIFQMQQLQFFFDSDAL
jgi:hypothetical protein